MAGTLAGMQLDYFDDGDREDLRFQEALLLHAVPAAKVADKKTVMFPVHRFRRLRRTRQSGGW